MISTLNCSGTVLDCPRSIEAQGQKDRKETCTITGHLEEPRHQDHDLENDRLALHAFLDDSHPRLLLSRGGNDVLPASHRNDTRSSNKADPSPSRFSPSHECPESGPVVHLYHQQRVNTPVEPLHVSPCMFAQYHVLHRGEPEPDFPDEEMNDAQVRRPRALHRGHVIVADHDE